MPHKLAERLSVKLHAYTNNVKLPNIARIWRGAISKVTFQSSQK